LVPPITRVSSFRLRKDVAAAATVAHICDNNKALVMFFMLLIGCIDKAVAVGLFLLIMALCDKEDTHNVPLKRFATADWIVQETLGRKQERRASRTFR